MFSDLGERLTGIFERLRGRGVLTQEDVDGTLRSMGDALLDADVAVSLVNEVLELVGQRSVGRELLRSVTPGQQVAKIVHDVLVEKLGGGDKTAGRLRLDGKPPAVILTVGLQGVGKTTTSAKLAAHLKARDHKVLLASLDVSRPAAREQLRQLGEMAKVMVLPEGTTAEMPVDIALRARRSAEAHGFDVAILDTAGRGQIDEALMSELAQIHEFVNPAETLLVVDALSGQNAANMAREFSRRVAVSGLVLTRIDGDSRGGAALSARHVSGVPIKFLGVGEKIDALEPFHAERIAGRILGMGDVASLVEKADRTSQARRDIGRNRRKKAGVFDLDDMATLLRQMTEMGGLGGILGLLPGIGGMGKLKSRVGDAGFDEDHLSRSLAIISSMTLKERSNPRVFNAGRKRRVASGSGVSVQEVNQLLKFHRQIADVMKKSGNQGLLSMTAGADQLGAPNPGFSPGGMAGLPFGMIQPGFQGGMGAVRGGNSKRRKRKK